MSRNTTPMEGALDAHIGERLRQRRIAMGWSQETLGKSLGVTFQQVQKMENGRNRIPGGRLWRASILLEVPVAYFFEEMPGDGAAPAATDHRAGPRELSLLRHFKGLSPHAQASIYALVRTLTAEAADNEGAQ